MKRLLIAVISVAFGLATAEAEAHAFLDHASPAVGSTENVAPPEVSIWFTEEVEPAFSKIEVTDRAGNRVDAGTTRVDEANPKLLHVSLKPLPPGTYKVTWHIVSIDTHHTDGDFSFTVAP